MVVVVVVVVVVQCSSFRLCCPVINLSSVVPTPRRHRASHFVSGEKERKKKKTMTIRSNNAPLPLPLPLLLLLLLREQIAVAHLYTIVGQVAIASSQSWHGTARHCTARHDTARYDTVLRVLHKLMNVYHRFDRRNIIITITIITIMW